MFKNDIRSALLGNWKETRYWLCWNLIGSLFPVWGGIIIFIIFSIRPHFTDFSKNGQFAIYSATMLASSLYIVLKDYRYSKYSGRYLYGTMCILGLVFSTILFASVTVVETG
jgi:hypothetical protein